MVNGLFGWKVEALFCWFVIDCVFDWLLDSLFDLVVHCLKVDSLTC